MSAVRSHFFCKELKGIASMFAGSLWWNGSSSTSWNLHAVTAKIGDSRQGAGRQRLRSYLFCGKAVFESRSSNRL